MLALGLTIARPSEISGGAKTAAKPGSVTPPVPSTSTNAQQPVTVKSGQTAAKVTVAGPGASVDHSVQRPATQRTQSVSLAFDWVTIPAGEFLMGSDKSKDADARDDESPQHTVNLPAFRIARVPVTNAQYKKFVDATGHQAPKHWKNGQIPDKKEDHPVVYVSWHDALAFCTWAQVRLPTEADWEKAARGADGRIFPWGNAEPDDKRCNFNKHVGDTTPVGRYPTSASPYGCLDMAGNVWEWTGSLYKSYPYDAGDARELRVMRGGTFFNRRDVVRCAFRSFIRPDYGLDYIGFRVVSPGL